MIQPSGSWSATCPSPPIRIPARRTARGWVMNGRPASVPPFQGRTGAFNFGGQAPSIACTSGTERFATATFDLPAGAAIKYVDMFAYDNSSSEEMLVFLLSVCQGTGGADPPVSTILANSTTSGTPGDTVVTLNLSSAPVIVDRYTCRYMVRVNMASPGGTCVGGSIFLDKVRMQYTP
jgi:hypothetical protein